LVGGAPREGMTRIQTILWNKEASKISMVVTVPVDLTSRLLFSRRRPIRKPASFGFLELAYGLIPWVWRSGFRMPPALLPCTLSVSLREYGHSANHLQFNRSLPNKHDIVCYVWGSASRQP